MLTFVFRDGPPEALTCPVFLCDECHEPIQAREGGDGFGGLVAWREREDGTQEVSSTHKGRCNRSFEAKHPGAHWSWDEIGRVIDQLAHNTHSAFPAEDNVEYYAPAPSTWRKGRYERGR